MSPTPKHVRIFLASPSDVQDERSLAMKVIENVIYDPSFVEKVSIRIVAWDKNETNVPMMASMTPQMAITAGMPKPSDCDIVVVIFWSRMGTPLPDEYQKEDGTNYASGTEWEFEDALRAAKEFGKPDILVYRRTDNITLDPNDSDFMKKYEQWKKVQDFFSKFVDIQTGVINMGINEYSQPENFRRNFESHIKSILNRLISDPSFSSVGKDQEKDKGLVTREIWEGSPFPGLRSYSEREAPIFYGRGLETDDLLKQLENSRFVSIVGVSGSGKSSLVSAGMIPRLRDNAISANNQGSKDWYIIEFKPNNDPFHQLAGALLSNLPSMKGDPVDFSNRKQKLADTLKSSKRALSDTIEFALQNEEPWVEALIFIDQFEELFTLCDKEIIKPFISMITHSVQSASLDNLLHGKFAHNRIRYVLTLRADFYHRCVEYPELAELLRVGSFPLAAPSQLALQEMITKPAERAALEFDQGLPERILQDTGNEPGSLALVAYTLDELYHAGKEKQVLSHQDYDSLGGVKGAIGRRAEAVYNKLPSESQNMLPRIFQNLIMVDHRGIATRERTEYEKIGKSEAAARLIDAFTDARILVQSRGEYGAVVEVAHEAIFKSWKRLSDWIEETRSDLYLLMQLDRAAKLWDEKGRSRDFLWLGQKNKELQDVISRLDPDLDKLTRSFARTEQEHLEEELMDRDISHARRSEIGIRLSVIGDTRHGVGLRDDGIPDIVWVSIPSGVVRIRDNDFHVPSFYISKYPITYGQYESFLNHEKGFENTQWWKDFPASLQKQRMYTQLFKFANHPRDNVSWYQAYAFTRWLAEFLPEDGYPITSIKIQDDNRWIIRLPTEWEWQHAAMSGNTENQYPWGKEWNDWCCNTLESGLNRTTAVGMYPEGDTESGISDLAGNIREWCINEYTNFSVSNIGVVSGRTSKGGSYSSIKEFAKCKARYCDDPDEQPCDDGFRVVFAPEIITSS